MRYLGQKVIRVLPSKHQSLHPGCCSLSLLEPMSRHRKPKACKCKQAETDEQT